MLFNRTNVIAAVILATLALISWIPRLKGPLDLRWDGGAYYVLGSALAEGKGYRLLNEPGDIQTTLHPPMLPAIVALHQIILGTSDVLVVGPWLRRTYVVLFIAYIVAIYLMLGIFLPASYAFLATLICLLQIHTLFMSDLCFPEIPFGLVTVVFTLCKLKDGSAQRLLRAPLAVISYALRTVGVALLAAWVIESVFQRRFRQAAIRSLIALVPVLCWVGYVAHIESTQEYKNPAYAYQRAGYNYINVSYAQNLRYKDSFSPELGYASLKDKAAGFLNNLALMPVSLGEAVSTREPIWNSVRSEINRRAGHSVIPSSVIRLSFFFFAALIVAGIGLQWKQQQYFIPSYILLSVAAISATPWPGQFNRYLTPLAPFLSLSLFLALWSTVEWWKKRAPEGHRLVSIVVPGAVSLLILVSQVPALLPLFTIWHQRATFDASNGERVEYRLFFYDARYQATDAGLDWLKARASGGEVLAATDPQWAYLRTGLKSVLPPFELDPDAAQHSLDSVPVKFLVVDDSLYRKYTAAVVSRYPDQWRRIYGGTSAAGEAQSKIEIYERAEQR